MLNRILVFTVYYVTLTLSSTYPYEKKNNPVIHAAGSGHWRITII